MTTRSISQSHPGARRPEYHSRVQTIIVKELGDLFLRSRLGLALAAGTVALVPLQLALLSYLVRNESSDLAVKDQLIRVLFGFLFAGALLGNAVMIGERFFVMERRMDTVEPLCAAGVKRDELVLGKLAAMFLTWCAFVAVTLLILSATSLPFAHSAFPILDAFHPDVAFMARLGLVLLCGGAAVFGLSALLAAFGLPAFVRDSRLKAVCGALAALVVLGFKVPSCWPLLALSPGVNLWLGTVAAITQLPLDPRITVAPMVIVAPWEHPQFALIAIAGAIVQAGLFTWIAIRRFRNGVPNA